MALYEINLKVYVNYDGTLYNKGSKNVLRPIYKLSNAVYKLSLITPIAPTNVLYASFQKADGTKTTQQLMAYDGIEVVDGNNWNVYTLNINNSITNVSERQRDNSLSFDFNVSDGNSTPALLNTEPIVVKCQYSIIGQEVEVSQSDLDQILASVMATLKNRDKDKVFSVTFLPSVVEDETDDNYNVGYVYLLNGKYTAITEIPETPDPNVAYLWNGETRTTAPILVNGKYYRFKDSAWQELVNYSQNKGNIYRAVKGGYAEIARGIEYINTLMTDVTNIKNALGDTSQIPSGSTITALVLQNVSDITQLKNDVLDLGSLVEQNQNQINTINQSIESINNELGSLTQRLTTAENDIVTLTNSLNQIGSSVMENTESIASLQGAKLNKDFSNIAIGNTIADNDYVVVNSGGVSYKILFSKLKELIGGGGGVNHYKGDFISYEALVQAVPVGEPGDYAFVNTENELVMYIWDSDDNTWKETTHGQYVSTATFAEFQQGLITNGTIVANTASNYYTANGNKNIESEFSTVNSSINQVKEDVKGKLTTTINIQPTDTILSDSDYELYKQNPYGTTIVESGAGINVSYRCYEDLNNIFLAIQFLSDNGYVEGIIIDNSSPHTITRQIIKLDVPSDVRNTINHSISVSVTLDNNNNPSWTDSEKEKFLNAIEVGNLNRVGLSFNYFGGIAEVCATYNGAFTLTGDSLVYIFSTSVVPDVTFEGDDFIPTTLAIVVLVNSDNSTHLTFFETELRYEEREVKTIIDIDFNAEPGQQGLISSDKASEISNALLSKSLVEIQVGKKLYSFQSGRVIGSGSVSVDNVVYFSNVEKTDTDVIVNTLEIDTQNLTYIITSNVIPKDGGFVDISSLIPSGVNIATSNSALATLLNSAYDAGYTKVYAEQESSKSSFYAFASKPTTDGYKANWQGFFFYNETDTRNYECYFSYQYKTGTFNNNQITFLSSDRKRLTFMQGLLPSQSGNWYNAIMETTQISPTGGATSLSYMYLDMFGTGFTLPTITSAKQTISISALAQIYKNRKIVAVCKNVAVGTHTISTINTTLYGTAGFENNGSMSYFSKFVGGPIVDEIGNEYDLEIENTGTLSSQQLELRCIQRSIKITGLPDTATNGTFTDYEISTLQNGTKYIEFNNELYELNDKQHISGYLTFSHLGAENSKHMTKCITVTISAKTWVLTTQEVMPVIANPTGDATANLTKVQIGDVIYSIPSGGGGSTELMVSTTYANLVSLKTNSQLQKGVLYRITDYTATTSQPYTRETINQFDILVRATSENTLDENANAILHSGDTYFANCKLENWVLKYCLTNDSSRFYWADTSSGKGVVYYLRDEWGNEAPYDFKNIQFELYKITACPNVPGLVGKYTFSTDNAAITTNNTDNLWTYTFGAYVTSETKMYDMSVEQSKWGNDEGGYNNTCENKIGEYHGPDHSYGPLVLNKTAFLYMDPEADDFFPPQYNTIGANNYENVFNGYNCMNNIVGIDFTRNTLLGQTTHLHVGIGCYYLVSDSYMLDVKFKLSCSNIYLSNIVMSSCSFGVSCANNVFSGNGNAVSDFTLEDNCSNLSLTIPSGQNGPISRVYVEAGTSGFLSSAIAKVDIYDSQMVNNEAPITISRDTNDNLLMLWQSDGRTQGCKTKSVSSYTNWTATDDSAKPYATKEYVDSHSGSKEVISKAITSVQSIRDVTFTAEEWTKLKAGADLVFTYLTITYLTERVMNLLPNPLVNNDNIVYKVHNVDFANNHDAVFEGYVYTAQNSDGTAGVTQLLFLATPIRYGYDTIPVDAWVESTEASGYGYSLTLDFPGLTSISTVDVYFSIADASSGNFAPFVKTSDNQFTIYAKTKPTTMMEFDVIVNLTTV